MIREDSPLRHPPRDLSRRQVLVVYAIRYAADMVDIAYERQSFHLQKVAAFDGQASVRDIASGTRSTETTRSASEMLPTDRHFLTRSMAERRRRLARR